MRILILPLILLAAACSLADETPVPSAADQATAAYQPPPLPTDAERQACVARDGRMQQVGMLGSHQCIVHYADAGKRCTDGDQCQGDCWVEDSLPPPPQPGEPAVATPRPSPQSATEGVCQPDSNRFGCYTTIEDGRAEATICVD